MKRVVRPPMVLCIGGRIMMLLFIAFPILLLYKFVEFAIRGEVMIQFLICGLGFGALIVWLLGFFWQTIWGKLIFTDTELIWKCFRCKTVKMKYVDIKRIEVRSLGDRDVVKRDPYKTGHGYILISESCVLPTLTIDKIQCGKGLIKWLKTPVACEALREHVPSQFRSMLK